jgi:small-conductance mechanosensitive channel
MSLFHAETLRVVAELAGITALLAALFWALRRLHIAFDAWLSQAAERHAAEWSGQAMRTTGIVPLLRRAAFLALALVAAMLAYFWVAFVLRRFPATRPWGEWLREWLLAHLTTGAIAVASALPGLVAVLLIAAAARWATRGIRVLFDAAARSRISLPGIYPDTAAPTRRLAIALLWIAALVVAYPYMPGSGSAAFKGISVFLGVVLSFGSTGVVQHLLSGLMLTYARAVRVGDFARIGAVEGTVVQIGAVATKVRTAVGEEVTIPNGVVVAGTLVNYSSPAGGTPALVATSVTIGYDTPWREVEALLLAAASRSTGLRDSPAPVVWRVALEDFSVKYTLLVAPIDPRHRAELLDRLHAHILDAFNEHGVQIMSPHYMSDPASPKVVRPSPRAVSWHGTAADAPRPQAK